MTHIDRIGGNYSLHQFPDVVSKCAKVGPLVWIEGPTPRHDVISETTAIYDVISGKYHRHRHRHNTIAEVVTLIFYMCTML